MDLEYLIQLEPVYRCLCRHLRTQDLLLLGDVSVSLRRLVKANPNTWKHLDLSGRSQNVIMHFLRHDAVPGALRELVLDCSDVSETGLLEILMRCSNIDALGIGGCTKLLEGLISAVLECKRNGYAEKLKFLGLLGAPHLKTTGVMPIAASISKQLRGLGIETDLVRCMQEHAFTTDPDNHWHLALDTPSICASCKCSVRACYPCINSRTCRGCFHFWCFECENPISRVCYECGHSCSTCKQGIYVKCRDCGSMFCKLHGGSPGDRYSMQNHQSAIVGRTLRIDPKHVKAPEDCCDWCIQGRNQGYGH